MPLEAIIFDFDGVIGDTSRFNINAMKSVFERKNLNFSDEVYENYFTGRTLKNALDLFLSSIKRENEIDEFITLKKEHDKYFADETKIYPDAYEFIRKYKNSLRMAVATGSRPIHLDLFFKKYSLENIFESIVTSQDTPNGKPHPDGYLLSLKKLNLHCGEAVVIEDTLLGIKSAKAAGIKCIAVTNTYSREKLLEADLIVDKLTEKMVDSYLLDLRKAV